MSEVQEAPNNAAVEIARRRTIVESREKQKSADSFHRENVPDNSVPRSPVAHPSRMRLAEYDRQEWIVNAEPGHTIDDILKPGYWAHMAPQMSAYDHIEVRAEDGSWVADLLVVQVDRMWAKVVLKSKFEFSSSENPTDVDQHVVEWKGPQHRFAVIRISDREKIRDGFHTKEEAGAWMREHERVISG